MHFNGLNLYIYYTRKEIIGLRMKSSQSIAIKKKSPKMKIVSNLKKIIINALDEANL